MPLKKVTGDLDFRDEERMGVTGSGVTAVTQAQSKADDEMERRTGEAFWEGKRKDLSCGKAALFCAGKLCPGAEPCGPPLLPGNKRGDSLVGSVLNLS